jgi:hypothetical protein
VGVKSLIRLADGRSQSKISMTDVGGGAGSVFSLSSGCVSIEIAIVYRRYKNMESEKIGIPEFRRNLAGYLESGC